VSPSFRLCRALIIFVLVLCERSSSAAASGARDAALHTITLLQHDVAHLSLDTTSRTHAERAALDGAESSLAFLRHSWTSGTTTSAAYVRSLDNDDRIIIAASSYASDKRRRAIFFVRDDLGLKERNCRATLARGGRGLGADVNVAVTTKLAGHAVKGYDIYWNWAFLVGTEQPTKLSRQSSPATGRVPAGLIMFWAHKGKEDLMKDTALPVHIGGGSSAFDLSVYE
jgi:hypothetical protein